MVKLSPESSQRARLGMPSATGACMGDTSERVCLRGVQCRPVITRCSHLFCGDCFHQYARKQAGLLSCRALQAGAQSQFPGRAPQESEDADGARPVLSCIPVSLALALSLSVLSASLSLARSLLQCPAICLLQVPQIRCPFPECEDLLKKSDAELARLRGLKSAKD